MSHSLYNDQSTSAVPHSAVHDMESFFWVLLYVCLTRAGPAENCQGPQPKLSPQDQERLSKVDTMCHFFDSEPETIVNNNKNLLHKGEIDIDEYVSRSLIPVSVYCRA